MYLIGSIARSFNVEGRAVRTDREGGADIGLGEIARRLAPGSPLSVTFADYLMPTLAETPPIDLLLTGDAPSPYNGLGVKGAGEGGINAVGAAIASAIDAAIGIPGAIDRLPVTPERLRAVLKAAGKV